MIVRAESANSAEILSPFAGQILDHLLYQGSRNDCAPFTAATLIHALRHIAINPLELADQINKPVWRGAVLVIRRIPNWATFPWGIVDVLRQYGLPARWQLFVRPDQVLRYLSTNILYLPILLSWRPLWAHVVTLVAYQPDYGFGFANTQTPQPEIDWMAEDRFLTLWRASLYCTVIVTP